MEVWVYGLEVVVFHGVLGSCSTDVHHVALVLGLSGGMGFEV